MNLRVISLNTWGGRALHPLMKFFREHADSVDVFCLQEVFDTDQEVIDHKHPEEHICGTLFRKISKVLPEFEGTFAYFDDNPHRQSLALFMRRTLPTKTIADLIIHQPEKPQEEGSAVLSARKLQYATFEKGGRELLVANFHGLWNMGPKTDTKERIDQSESIKKFLKQFSGAKILCGDFNLLPETRSLSILEEGMKNLVTEADITSTRTPLYRKHQDPDEPKFADYIFVSPDVTVKHFKVLPDIASDHAPLYLECSI